MRDALLSLVLAAGIVAIASFSFTMGMIVGHEYCMKEKIGR
jgi:hypothetical protein